MMKTKVGRYAYFIHHHASSIVMLYDTHLVPKGSCVDVPVSYFSTLLSDVDMQHYVHRLQLIVFQVSV